jgi:hypothetical protein
MGFMIGQTHPRAWDKAARYGESIYIYLVRVGFPRPSPCTLDTCNINLGHRNTEGKNTQQVMVFVPHKLALRVPLLFLLFVAQILPPVAGQASPAPTPCKGATNTTTKIKDAFIFQQGLSQPLDPGLARTLPVEYVKSSAWSNSSQFFFAA